MSGLILKPDAVAKLRESLGDRSPAGLILPADKSPVLGAVILDAQGKPVKSGDRTALIVPATAEELKTYGGSAFGALPGELLGRKLIGG